MTMMETSIRVLLVDNEDIVLLGLKALLSCESSIDVIGEASNGLEAIALTQEFQPDIVLMDIAMPQMDGIVATEKILHMRPQTKVLILTTHNDSEFLLKAIHSGAMGYLLKNTPPEDFINIVRSAHKGYMQFGPGLNHRVRQQVKPKMSVLQQDCVDIVTPREKDVLSLIAEGANNREIAQRLQIAEKTVKNHVSNILSRLGLRDRTQLAIWANQCQISS